MAGVGGRNLGATLLVILVAATVPPFGPPTGAAQAASEVIVPDGSGDVAPSPASPAGLPAGTDGLDIVGARLFGETGEAFLLEVQIKDIKAEGSVPGTVNSGVHVAFCFKWGGTLYAAKIMYTFAPSLNVNDRVLGAVTNACDGSAQVAIDPVKRAILMGVAVDEAASTILFPIYRMALAGLNGIDPPMAGEQITDLRVVVHDGRRDRVDVAPNAGPHAEAYSFAFHTANTVLKAAPDANVATSIPCGGRRDLFTYAIEAGGKRGIPIVLQNLGASDATVDLTVSTLSGAEWDPQMMPSVTLPGAAQGVSQNVTVNVIVDTPAGTSHKDCTTILVRALDPTNPHAIGETALNVVAVSPPSAALRTLYMHSDDKAVNTCGSHEHTWLNVVKDDPDDKKREVLLMYCRDNLYILGLAAAQAGIISKIDVNPSHDLVLNTSAVLANAVVTLKLRSDIVPTNARLDVSIITGPFPSDSIGDASAVVEIGSSVTTVVLDVPIAFTRDQVAEGDPSRVIPAEDGIGIRLVYTPLPVEPNVQAARVAGKVVLLTDGSQVELPIYATIKRNVNDPGQAGGLLSITASGLLPGFALPGSAKLLNVTVLNEGAVTDSALPTVEISGVSGWTSQVVPPGPYVLGPGERRDFQVAVTPPAEARESEAALVDIIVTSQSDPTARASLSHRVVATREGGVAGDLVPDAGDGGGGGGGFLPGPSLAVALAGVAAAGALLRRRRP